jgi:ribosomal protein S18 acetylase RimI-like enzyme
MFEFVPIEEKDLPFLIEVRNECREFLHDNRMFTLTECEQWFREKKPNFFIILLNGERIGYLRLSHYNLEEASIYVGADLHPNFRGQGLAQRVYEAFWPLLIARYHVATAKLEVLSHNAAAQHLYHKLGFVEIARHSGYALRNKSLVDSIVMLKVL